MLEIYDWSGEGFAPLVFAEGWQAALLNWEPLFDRRNLDEIERHNHSDEVFVLLRGRAVLFTRADDEALQAVEMERGKIYNVPARIWHNLVATRDLRCLIVENRDTHLHDTEIRPITDAELAQLDARLPAWARS
ncbi:MAG: cupin domain-containing protein [Chloroflexi bacterium]|nr:cupin domain-containing protein [Chloroflexota bacterium]